MRGFRSAVSHGRPLSASLYAGIEIFADQAWMQVFLSATADILNEFLPDLSCFNHATTRNRVLAVGKAIETETRAEIAGKPTVEKPVEHLIVGIDGALVKATRSKNQRRNFEIVLGRIEPCGRQDKILAAVRDLDDLARERVRFALRSAGRGPATNLTVLSDGEDAMRLMAGKLVERPR